MTIPVDPLHFMFLEMGTCKKHELDYFDKAGLTLDSLYALLPFCCTPALDLKTSIQGHLPPTPPLFVMNP